MVNLDALLDAKKDIYVINRSKAPRGLITFTLFRADGQPYIIIAPKTWIPINLSGLASHEALRTSDDLRRNIHNGMVELIDPEKAVEMLKDPDAQEELVRLNISKHTAYDEDIKALDTVEQFTETLDQTEDVNIKIKEILARDVSLNEKYHLLRSDEEIFTENDFKYIILHAEGKIKDWAKTKLH